MKPMIVISEILELEKLVMKAEEQEESCKNEYKQAKEETAKAVQDLRQYIDLVRTRQIPLFLELPARSDQPGAEVEPAPGIELDRDAGS
jgi:hypothetical protein